MIDLENVNLREAERWSDDRARYAAIECAKVIEAQVPT